MDIENNIKNKEWKNALNSFLNTQNWQNIKNKIIIDKKNGKIIFPKIEDVFNALNFFPPEETKVIILGQDPYHGDREAHGLSFSVPNGVKKPSSLNNIFKELNLEYKKNREVTDLSDWASQGVLLLNSILTVERDLPKSHANIGWEYITTEIINIAISKSTACVIVLWGGTAQKTWENGIKDNKIKINSKCNLKILKSAHPSGLSCYRGFIGNNHFKEINSFLLENNKNQIIWC